MLTDTATSPHAVMTSVPPGSVQLSGAGPLGALRRRALEVTIPSMGGLMFDADVAHALENFRVASGEVEGEHRAAPFMDGDLYKWLEAATVALGDAPDLADQVRVAADAIRAAQRDDGYLQTKTLIARRHGSEVEPLTQRLDFETYNLGHLMTLGCLHHRATGAEMFREVAVRAAEFLRHAVETEPDAVADCNICPSHYMGVVEVYRSTGDPRYLELARRLLELHGGKGAAGGDDNQDVLAVQDQQAAKGHAVRANYLFAGMTDYVLETGDPAMRATVERLWQDVVSAKIYLTGGCGALYDGASPDAAQDYSTVTKVHQSYGRPYQLPHTTAYSESCATIGFVLWSWRMLTLTGDGRYADEIERVLLNALPGMIGAEGASYFYTNPMRQVADLPYQLRRAGDPEGSPLPPSDARLRQEYMTNCFCCPPNIARTIAELPYYALSQGSASQGSGFHGPGEIWVHQYLAGTASLALDGVPVVLETTTRYPVTGEVRIRVRAERPVRGTVRVRVPGWARGATVTVDGEPVGRLERGYAVIEREWSDQEVRLDAPMRVRTMVAHPFVEEATNQVAVMRGPVVYCLESADLPAGVRIDEVHLPEGIGWQEEAGTGIFADWVLLRGEAVRIPSPVPAGELYAELPDVDDRAPVHVRLVPYGRWANRGPGEMSVWLPLLRSAGV